MPSFFVYSPTQDHLPPATKQCTTRDMRIGLTGVSSMQTVIISGSRNPHGQTARAANALLEGITCEDGRGELIFLPQLTIARCQQCDANGWGECRTDGRCVTDDDFPALVEKITAADLCVFASPVYWGDLSESLRAFLDRLRRVCTHSSVKESMRGKAAVGVCVAGGGGGGAPSCLVSMEKVLRTCGFDVLDMIPVRRQNLELKLTVLRLTGAWLVKQASSETESSRLS